MWGGTSERHWGDASRRQRGGGNSGERESNMLPEQRAEDRRNLSQRARAGVLWRLLVGVCALALLCLSFAFVVPRLPNLSNLPSLPFPVTLANTPAHGIVIPAEIRHSDQGATLVIVQVLIQGKGPYPMALDTGASLTLLDRTLANQLGLVVAGPSEQITGVGGVQQVTPVKVSKWSLGKAQLPAMTITSAPLLNLRHTAEVDGLLGSDVLSRVGAVTIDYTSSQVTLYPIASGTPTSLWSREAVE